MSDEFDELHPAVRALKTVCRCNNVKYRTIEKAILGGATSVRDVAARTTATTGYCGGTCTPDILKMIEKIAAPARVAAEPADDPDAWWLRKK